MSNPEEPDGVNENFTDKDNKDLNSLKDLDPETTASTPLLPRPSPQETNPVKCCGSTSLQLDDLPSAKKRDGSTEPSDTKNKGETSSDLLEYTFLGDICNDQNNIKTDKIRESLILKLFWNILMKRKEALSNIKDTQLPREKGVNDADMKKQFFKMFKKSDINIPETGEYTQYAFAIIKWEDNSSYEGIGPYYPGDSPSESHLKSHSEDKIIKDVTEIIEKHEKKISEMWIYTWYNPCIGRNNHTPCMYNLLSFSQKHTFKTYICFTEYYICYTEMDKIFLKSISGDYIEEIIEKYDLDPQSKSSVTFNINEGVSSKRWMDGYNNEFQTFMKNIPEDKKKVVYENKISPKSLDLELTYKEWKEKIGERAERLISEMIQNVKEIIGESFEEIETHYDKFKSAIIKCWVGNIRRSILIDEKFIEFIKEKVVLHYLEDIQRLPHPPVIFQIDLHNLHHEE